MLYEGTLTDSLRNTTVTAVKEYVTDGEDLSVINVIITISTGRNICCFTANLAGLMYWQYIVQIYILKCIKESDSKKDITDPLMTALIILIPVVNDTIMINMSTAKFSALIAISFTHNFKSSQNE